MNSQKPKEDACQQPEPLLIQPIGYIRSNMQAKFAAPHQPNRKTHANKTQDSGVIELNKDYLLEASLADLHDFSHIWLVWWFHRNKTWRPMVMPPRGPEKRRGVFATRSPHRPNPIGITAVELVSIKRNKIYIGSHDLVDGTPIIDIKPYLPEVDSFPEAQIGWIGEVEEQLKLSPSYQIKITELANQQLAWLEKHEISFIERASELLSIDPSPHRTRRITQLNDNSFRMGCGSWRLFFSLFEKTVTIEKFEPGYPLNSLVTKTEQKILDREEQLKFYKHWLNCDIVSNSGATKID